MIENVVVSRSGSSTFVTPLSFCNEMLDDLCI